MGLFAGISLEGLTLRPDSRANEAVYGRKIDAPDIVRTRAADRAKGWITLLNKAPGTGCRGDLHPAPLLDSISLSLGINLIPGPLSVKRFSVNSSDAR